VLRLEGFGDIVFGFAVSQCALQLPTAEGHVDLAHPTQLLSYFGTFALLVILWLTYHRLMSGPFKPTRPDLYLAFTYLALVSLLPYAMYSITRTQASLAAARAAIAEYAILFGLMMIVAAVLNFRNLRRGWWTFEGDERDISWIAFVRECALCVMMALAATIDLTVGPTAGSIVFIGIIAVTSLIRIRVKRAPNAAALRIETPTG
jgi:uncharacterized membrane protein